jgi:hypothetical protein
MLEDAIGFTLLVRSKLWRACDQCHASHVVTFLRFDSRQLPLATTYLVSFLRFDSRQLPLATTYFVSFLPFDTAHSVQTLKVQRVMVGMQPQQQWLMPRMEHHR